MKISTVLGLVFLALGAYGGWCVYRFYKDAGPQCVLSDASSLSLLSSSTSKKLNSFFKKQGRKYEHASLFCAALQQEFPVLKAVTCEQKNSKKVMITVTCARPLFVVNEGTVLTELEKEVPASVYAPELVATLAHFTVAQYEPGSGLSQDCILYVKGLPTTLTNLYDVEWVDDSLIKFHDKQYPEIMVLGCAETHGERLLHYSCDVLKMALLERKPSRKGRKDDWVIDMRFKGQVVVFPGGKGSNEKAVYG